jgi:hypothetical protein
MARMGVSCPGTPLPDAGSRVRQRESRQLGTGQGTTTVVVQTEVRFGAQLS